MTAGEQPLWSPSPERASAARITSLMGWLRETRGLELVTYDDLWRWSVSDLEAFWQSIAEFFDVRLHSPATRLLADASMPGARWFEGATLNYAEHALRRRDDAVAVIAATEDREPVELSFAGLARQVGAAAAGLRKLGVGRGDRVAALLPNVPETLVAFLATASIGAIWSSCAPEFGAGSVVDRFAQIEPRVLLAVDGYSYNGKPQDRREAIAELRRRLPTVEATVVVPNLDPDAVVEGTMSWASLLAADAEPAFEPVPFDHPLWVLYSSGTTGLPKAIVQGHGGILLEHLKALGLHLDLGPEDRFFWFSTTGWMMWNFLVSGLLVESAIVLYDGSPGHPDINALWKLAADTSMTYFGTSAPYVMACRKAGIEPGRDFDLSRLRAIGSTGAPLPPEGFRWLYEHVGSDLLVGSASGGTDLCTAFVGPCPLLPVYAGELQCRTLGAKVEAFDEEGNSVVGQVGELVITEPMPSMPLGLWGDADGARYRESYFEQYPGVWRHGDWIEITDRGSCIITGRSDSTLNRGGVRMGTADFYRAVEALPEVDDSLVVEVVSGSDDRLELFVVPADGVKLDDDLRGRIASHVRRELSPRHVPDGITEITAVPRTLNGKKLEVPVKRLLEGRPLEGVLSRDAVANPEALEAFVQLAERRGRS